MTLAAQLRGALADVLPPALPAATPADVAPQPAETWGPFLFVALVLVAVIAVGVVVMRIRRGRADDKPASPPENRLSEGHDETYG